MRTSHDHTVHLKRKSEVKAVLQQAGALLTKTHRATTRDGSTKAIHFPRHTSLMRSLYGDSVPKQYVAWCGKSTNELAWAAGLLDGEGYVGAYWNRYGGTASRNPNATIKVAIGQNHLDTLKRFQEILQVHGQIRPASQKVRYRKPVYYLTYENRHALEVMRRLLPYLVRKRPNVYMCQHLWTKGCFESRPGPVGHPPEVWDLRARIINALAALK